MAIDIRQAEVLLLTDRSGIKTKTNVNRTNKPSTKSGHLHITSALPRSTPTTWQHQYPSRSSPREPSRTRARYCIRRA